MAKEFYTGKNWEELLSWLSILQFFMDLLRQKFGKANIVEVFHNLFL